MKVSSFPFSALVAVAVFAATGLGAHRAWADDTAVTEAVQNLTDAVTAAATDETTSTTAAAASAASAEPSDADLVAADEAVGLPKFKSREERRQYLQKLRQENPEKFEQIMKKRGELWAQKHPELAKKIAERKQWAKEHPEEAQKKREEFKERMKARKEAGLPPLGRDFRENRRDRLEDVRDRKEDRWDAHHNGGKRDRLEDRMDRREDRMDRKEDRFDAKHGRDRGRPGYGR